MANVKYSSDEERREAKNASSRRSYHANIDKRRADQRERWREQKRKWRLENPGEPMRRSFLFNLKRYGLDEVSYNNVLLLQNKVCAICKKPEVYTHKGQLKKLTIDHNHKTGKFRGLLCHHCNLLLGHARDNITTLLAAVEYLRSSDADNDPL